MSKILHFQRRLGLGFWAGLLEFEITLALTILGAHKRILVSEIAGR